MLTSLSHESSKPLKQARISVIKTVVGSHWKIIHTRFMLLFFLCFYRTACLFFDVFSNLLWKIWNSSVIQFSGFAIILYKSQIGHAKLVSDYPLKTFKWTRTAWSDLSSRHLFTTIVGFLPTVPPHFSDIFSHLNECNRKNLVSFSFFQFCNYCHIHCSVRLSEKSFVLFIHSMPNKNIFSLN